MPTDPIIEIATHITPQQFEASRNTICFNSAVKGPVFPHLHGNQVSSEPSTTVGTSEFPGQVKFLDDEEYLYQDEADANFNIVEEEANAESYDYESDDEVNGSPLRMDSSTRENYDRATAPRIHTHCTPTARNRFLRRDQASPVSLVPSMHLTGKHIFARFFFSSSAALKQTPAQRPVLFVTVATGINTASGEAMEDRCT